MAIYTVGLDSDYFSITDALAIAAPGDTILLEAGYGPENVTIATNDLTVSGEASSVGIVLKLSAGVALLQLLGNAPIEVQDGPSGNSITGNLGSNLITVSQGADAVDGGPGTDRLVVDYGDSTAAITGDSTSNFTEAGTGRMVTITDGTIESFTVRTGSGADTVTTHSGNDVISLGSGANTATAGDGDNTVTGDDDADTITTGSGNDFVAAGAGTNTVTTNAGNDTVLSGSGADTIIVGDGDDEVTVTGGADTVDAGDGEDKLIIDYSASNTGIVSTELIGDFFVGYSGSFTAGAGNIVGFSAVENFKVTGGIGADIITAGDGEDEFIGGDGNDILKGNGGNDTFTGGSGNDIIDGGDDIDTAYFSGQRGDYVFTQIGLGAVTVEDTRDGSPDGTDTLYNVELQFFVNTAPTGTVTITGTAAEDEVLTASDTLADVDGLGEVSYQWQADGAPIDGATEAELTLTQDEVGKAITVVASYTDEQGTLEFSTSEPTELVINVNDEPGGEVTISGTLEQGEVLIASNDLTDEDGIGADAVSYQWFADGTLIEGATEAELTLTQDEVGKAITVVASYTDEQGTPETATSQPTDLVINVNDEPEGTVVISGPATEDQVLTATNTLTDGDGLGTDAVSYQWLADGEAIAGATNANFLLTQDQVDKTITVAASYTDSQNTAESVTSAATGPVANVNDAPVGAVTINGTATEDEVLTASNTLADEDGLGPITYQWQADGSSIADATDASYTVTQGEIGKAITVIASYVDLYNTNEAVASAATVPVVAGLPSFYFTTTDTGVSGQVKAMVYNGPVTYLNYEFAGTSSDEAVVGTAANDFLHLGAGDDAVDGGEGRDVIDGGTGSNFLTGGSGSDVFFLDGRNGETTWSTITDWQQGEQLSVWGWRDGVSQATFVEDAGAAGYRGVTMHADLNGNGVIDTSVTWTGLTQANLPATTIQDGLLWFA